MIREIYYLGNKIVYDLEYKKVKNINLRIKSDGTINVSANKRVPENLIEEFVQSKGSFILKAINHYSSQVKIQYFSEKDLKEYILDFCDKVYPYFKDKGILYPQIKFKKMVSRWGSCHPKKGVLTFNTNLMYAPKECVEYVVFHEFTHFLQANHSHLFYSELQKICPDWKFKRQKLKSIKL